MHGSAVHIEVAGLPPRSLHRDGDFIARTRQIVETHWYVRSWRETTRQAEVHLVVAWICGGVTEKLDFHQPTADRDLRRDGSSLGQAADIHRQNLASRCRALERSQLPCCRVPDGALTLTVSGKEE